MADTSIVHYYRVDTPAALAAWATYRAECAEVVAEAKAFAARFVGAAPVFAAGLHGRRFHGLAFDPPMPTDIWTHPDQHESNVQRPRTRIVGKEARKNPERVEALRQARSTYADHLPRRTAHIDPVLEAIGTDWGTLLFSGYMIAECDGALFVRTAAELGTPCVEITGGQFAVATKDRRVG